MMPTTSQQIMAYEMLATPTLGNDRKPHGNQKEADDTPDEFLMVPATDRPTERNESRRTASVCTRAVDNKSTGEYQVHVSVTPN